MLSAPVALYFVAILVQSLLGKFFNFLPAHFFTHFVTLMAESVMLVHKILFYLGYFIDWLNFFVLSLEITVGSPYH